MGETIGTWVEDGRWILKQAEMIVGCIVKHQRTMYGSFFHGVITCYEVSTPYYSSSWDNIFFDTIEEAKLETERLIRGRQIRVRGFLNDAFTDAHGWMRFMPFVPKFE